MEGRRPSEIKVFLFLRTALGTGRGEAAPSWENTDWQEVAKIAREQTVSALVFAGLSSLPCPPDIPEDVSTSLMLDSGRTEHKSSLIAAQASSLIEKMRSSGLSPILMKGPAVAAYYPEPAFRAGGDIDIYFREEEFSEALKFLKDSGFNPEPGPDGSYVCKASPASLDIHPRYFDLRPSPLLPSPGSPEAEILMLSSHILKHAMGPGVGLRQICDMAMALRGLEGKYDKQGMASIFKAAGLTRWNRLLCDYIRERLGVDAGIYPAGNRRRLGRLDRIIFSGGNFGHFAKGRSKALSDNSLSRKTDTFLRLLGRLPFGLRYGGREYLSYLSTLAKGNFGAEPGTNSLR